MQLVSAGQPQGLTEPQTPAPHVAKIYEKLNMADRKVQQRSVLLPSMQQVKQENNFFPPRIEEKQLFGKVIEWQMGC